MLALHFLLFPQAPIKYGGYVPTKASSVLLPRKLTGFYRGFSVKNICLPVLP